VKCRRYLWFF